MKRDFLTLADITPDEIEQILTLSAEMKQRHKNGLVPRFLEGQTVALLFHKPSLRTRTSFAERPGT